MAILHQITRAQQDLIDAHTYRRTASSLAAGCRAPASGRVIDRHVSASVTRSVRAALRASGRRHYRATGLWS